MASSRSETASRTAGPSPVGKAGTGQAGSMSRRTVAPSSTAAVTRATGARSASRNPRSAPNVSSGGYPVASVAVECARLGAAAVAVDHDPGAYELVRRNASAHDVDVSVVCGEAPGVLDGLPDPDAVFVGGGGPAVLDACLARRPARVVAAFAAVERVGPALAALTAAGYTADGSQLQANRLVPLPGGAHRLSATNPTYLLWGSAP